MTLLPAMKLRLNAPDDLIDLNFIDELRGIEPFTDYLEVGAMTLHDVVAESKVVHEKIPALSILASGIGDAQVRNRGTIGGSISNNDPAADYPAAVLGLNATITTTKRDISGDDFFTGMFDTLLEPGELLKSVQFPIPERAGYVKFPNPASRYAIAGVMVSQTGNQVRVAVTGAGPVAFRVTEMEQALADDFSPRAIEPIHLSSENLNEDMHATAEYRAHLVNVMARRATAAALSSAAVCAA